MKTFFLNIVLTAITTTVSAQLFYKNTSQHALSFNDLKTQFDTYKKTHNLTEEHFWKHYKRWEHETDLHTNAKGDIAGFDEYIQATIAMADEKQQLSNQNSTAAWVPFGPNVLPDNQTGYMENGIGRINCIAFHPTIASTYFVGVAQGGLWKTTNNGLNWTPLTDNLPITRISDISINPSNPNEMYISVCDFEYVGISLHLDGRKRNTHYGLGVYKTTDGGLNWAPTGLTYQLTNGDASLIRKVIINPTNTNELLACGVSGMYKSTNSGATWTKKLDSLFWDMHIDQANPAIIYAATGWIQTAQIGNAGVYKSIDFGNTWVMLPTNMPLTNNIQRVKLAIAPSNSTIIYALCVDLSGGLYGIYKSTNAGASWTFLPPTTNVLGYGIGDQSGGQGNYDIGLCVDNANPNLVYVGGINLWGSSDGCNSFNPIAEWTTAHGATIHGDIHYMAQNPINGNYFACTDGGVYRTSSVALSNWGVSAWPTVWTKLNDNIQISSFYRLSSSKNSANQLIAGAQDNASFYYNGGTWSTIFGGDGMDNCLNPFNTSDVVGSSQYGNIYYSSDNGISGWSNQVGAEWVSPIVADYNHAGVLYVGGENISQSMDFGQSWFPLSSIYSNTITLQSSEISALAVANTNSLVLYAARRVRYEYGLNGIVFKTTDGGNTFTNITNNLPDTLYYTSIEISASNDNTVYVSMAGFTATNKVFKTLNGGNTWQNISYNLPNIPINCVKEIPSTQHLMVATDIGIYILYDGTSTWVNASFGLPNVIVSDIEFNSPLNKIYISTFGRGIWSTDISTITSINNSKQLETLSFNLYPTVNNGTFSIDFTNEATNAKTMEIIDVMGKMVHQEKLKLNHHTFTLNLSVGTYYVKLSDEKLIGVKKMIVN